MSLSQENMLATPTTIIRIDISDTLSDSDINDLCDATEATITGGGMEWLNVPEKADLERYWRGVLAMPGRHLLVARMDGIICGAAQIAEPPKSNEAQASNAYIRTLFVAPHARGHGAGRRLLQTAEQLATEMGHRALHADVQEAQTTAMQLFIKCGFQRWGINPCYAFINGRFINGHFFSKPVFQPLTSV